LSDAYMSGMGLEGFYSWGVSFFCRHGLFFDVLRTLPVFAKFSERSLNEQNSAVFVAADFAHLFLQTSLLRAEEVLKKCKSQSLSPLNWRPFQRF
jgi:hypothetical protein